MKRTVLVVVALALSAVRLSAQTPQTPLASVTELEQTLATAGSQLAAIKAALQPVDCVASTWGEWSAWTPSSATDEGRTRVRTVLTPAANGGAACPVLAETETRPIVVVGPVIPIVADSAALTAALAAGGEYQLALGLYRGNFTITRPVTLTGAQGLAGRVTPADVAGWQLVALDRTQAVLTVRSSNVTVRGTTITGVASDKTAVVIGSNTATDVAQQPRNVTVDQNAILGDQGLGHRGIEMHGAGVTITRNHIAGWLEVGRESQAIWSNNGPGPYTIVDNYLEASGENVMFGGDDPKISGQVPSDIVIRGNTLAKLLRWRRILASDGTIVQAGKPGSVKNLLELKCAQRVTIEGNELDGVWRDMQDGNAFTFTPRNQYGGAPWCVVQDVTVRNNRVTHVFNGAFAQLLGISDNTFPTGRTARLVFEGNYSDAPKGFIVNKAIAGLTLTRNTLPLVRANLFQFTGTDTMKTTGLIVTANVFASGEYGASGEASGSGAAAFEFYEPGYGWTANVLEKTAARSITWPAGTQLLAPGGLAPLLDAQGHYLGQPAAGW